MIQSTVNSSNLIKAKAIELGFSACGISRAKRLDQDSERLQKWLDAGFNGTMGYLLNHFEKRIDPTVLEEGTKSVISVLCNYNTDQLQKDPEAPVISRYALGQDYHYVLKNRLRELLSYIQSSIGECNGRFFVDSAPLLEKSLATEAGLGWIGKNSLLIHPKLGSFVFLGELLTDIELEYDQPFGASLCGSCTRCMDSCPTQALTEPSVLDSRKCISYLTIETKNEIPQDLSRNLSNRLVGCDICQSVCPWNQKVKINTIPEFQPMTELLEMKREDWKNFDQSSYKRLFRTSAASRAGYKRIRNTLNYLLDSTDSASGKQEIEN